MKITISNLGMPRAWLPPKLLLIMKLIVIILITCLMQVSAHGVAQKLTYVKSNATIKEVFKEITKQTGYEVLYANKVVNDLRKIIADFKSTPLKEVLDKCLEKQNLVYSIDESKGIVIKEKAPSFLEKFFREDERNLADIRGVVRNETGEPLEGITVMVKGAKTGTRTDQKGEFVLKGVKKGDVLVFTGVSIEPFEYAVKDDKNIDLNLKARLVQLEEVAVNYSTGYQKISKERAVGSFEQLDSAAFHRRAGMKILDRLDGTVNGLLFNKKASATNNFTQIRGVSSLGAGGTNSSLFRPLIVVDNFPVDDRFDINSINPNDIENITVLKDAAAASIWGARAGNGVIVITTKKGKYSKPLAISISSNVTIESKPDLYYIPRVNTSDFIDAEKQLFDKGFYNASLSDVYSWPVVSPVVELLYQQKNNQISEADATNQINALREIDLRQQLNKYIYQPATTQQHYLGINGGTDIFNYNFSFGFDPHRPNIQGSKGLQKYTVNTTAGFKPLKNLEIQTRFGYTQGRNQISPVDFEWATYPYLRITDDRGEAISVPFRRRTAYLDTLNQPGLLDWRYKPLDEIRLANNNTLTRSVDLNLGASYNITKGLNASLNYQYRAQIQTGKIQNSINSFFTRDLVNRFYNPDPLIGMQLAYPIPVGDILTNSTDESSTRNGRASLNYNHVFGLHSITTMISTEVSETKGYSVFNKLYGYDIQNGSYQTNMDYFNSYPNIFASYPGSASQLPNGQAYYDQPLYRLISVLGNATYSFKGRYFLYGSARKDGANVFGVNTNNKWNPLWSVGGKWHVSKENFFKINWMQSLSIRSTYGYSGNVNGIASGKLTMLYFSNPVFYTGFIAANAVSVNNPELRWEKVATFNTAIDFVLMNGRLSGAVDLFSKKSTDVIANYPFDPTVGIAVSPVNSADLSTRGFEIDLSSKNLTGQINWTSSIGFSHAKTVITKLYQSRYRASDFISYGINASEGKLAYALSSYKWAGLDPLTGDPQGYLNGNISKNYNAIFSDSIQNQIYHGSSIPLYHANFQNSFEFKNFSLSFLITGRFNYYFRTPALQINPTGTLGGTNYANDYYKRWQKQGDEKTTNVPSIIYPVPRSVSRRDQFYSGSEIHVLRGDNIRLQDIRFAYKWSNKKNAKFPIKSAQIFLYPNNLNIIIWRKDKSLLDPDFSGGTSATAAPVPRTWTIGVSLNL